jgi:CheY-like chemotaxis protein
VAARTPGFEVVAEAADGDAAIRIAREVDPDMVIVDVRMAGRDGIDTARALTDEDPTRVVVLVSSADVRELAALARAAGRPRCCASTGSRRACCAASGSPTGADRVPGALDRACRQRVGWSGDFTERLRRSSDGPRVSYVSGSREGRRHSRRPTSCSLVGPLWWALCLASGAVAVLAGVFFGWHSDRDQVDRAVVEAAIVGVPLAVGLYSIQFGHDRRFGLLLIGAGLVWSLTALAASPDSLPYSIGRVCAWLIFPLLVYLTLAFPDGRLAAGWPRVLFGSITGLIVVLYVGSALFVDAYPVHTPWAFCNADCPPNAFMVVDSQPAVMDDVVIPCASCWGCPAGCGDVVAGAEAPHRLAAAAPSQRTGRGPESRLARNAGCLSGDATRRPDSPRSTPWAASGACASPASRPPSSSGWCDGASGLASCSTTSG